MRLCVLLVSVVAVCVSTSVWAQASDEVLSRAGDNRSELESALTQLDGDYRADLIWLLEHMPQRDLETLDADFLIENVRLARDAWTEAPWHDQVDLELYRDAILSMKH